MSSITDDVKKVVYAGIGAAAMTVEKAHDLADEFVKKGESVVSEGKAANEELKHKIKNKVKGKEEKEDEVVADSDYKEVKDAGKDPEEKKEEA